MSLFVTLGDILNIVVISFFVAMLVAIWLYRASKQARCKHQGTVCESQACDAICSDCGKNLGFIGTWREKERLARQPASG
jgi:hypothetical protein